jgi:peptidoglycan/LPS O-acetylase OafA/YrhL
MLDFKYRPDIDGLRAFAVSLVVLFHAGLGFTGGFIGVDVFFVISGFLITGLIQKELQNNAFSMSKFWMRRIRRIIPAATVMVAIVLAAGFFLLLPYDYEELARSAAAQQLMFSNVYFWRNTGYFDGPADLKPLLHTWSLAVEEQFYLGYPILLLFLSRFRRSTAVIVLASIAIVSLVLSEYAVRFHPVAAFFLLPTRAWEMLLGGLVCFLPSPARTSKPILEIASWSCVVAIGACGLLYSASTPFPGISAIIPCISTAVLIYCNAETLTSPAKLLASKLPVCLGLVSYSFYLWHWPLFAFAKYWLGNDLHPTLSIAILLLSLALSILSYKFIETPIRRGFTKTTFTGVAFATTLSTSLLLFLSTYISSSGGVPDRLPKEVRTAANRIPGPKFKQASLDRLQRSDVPVLGLRSSRGGTPDFILWGDSHALAICDYIDEQATKMQLSGVIAGRSGRVPILGVWRPKYKDSTREAAPDWNRLVMSYIRDNRIKHVVLAARWAVNIEGRPNGGMDTLIARELDFRATPESAKFAFEFGLDETLNELESLNASVYILKQVPLQKLDPQRAIVRSLMFRSLSEGIELPRGVSLLEHQARQSTANRIIDNQVLKRANVHAIDLSGPFFVDNGTSVLGNSSGSFYRDDDHVSILGSRELLGPILRALLIEIKNKQTPE